MKHILGSNGSWIEEGSAVLK